MEDESEEQSRREPELAVRGEQMSEVEPEVAYVTTDISARARRREDVFARLSERAEWQRGVLDRYDEQIERIETADLLAHPILDKAASEAPVGFSGTIRTKITIRDLSQVGDIVSDLTIGDMSEVVTLIWALRDTSPALRATRIAAVHDALKKARDYASAVGSQLTSLVEITDVGVGAGPSADVTDRPRPLAAERPADQFDFRPVRQTVHVQVEARFTITQPKFG